ncbi:cell division protein SepF [Filifactor villosus]|uniref:Cell division protein SepF n=1 Tax=Filifactor villosus TaxID=29374 RepID=A0ABV9QLD0_9FIRM
MAEKFTDKLKGYFSISADDEYEYGGYDEFDVAPEEPVSLPKFSSSNKVVNINTAGSATTGQHKVIIYEPTQYNEEIPAIVDSLKAKKACVVNLEKITDPAVSGTIFHFLNGAIYAMNGSVAKISTGIFIFAPPSVEIDGTVKKALESKGIFKWQ